MKRIITFVLALSMILSILPIVSFAEESKVSQDMSTYGLEENPLVFTKDTKYLTYEVEDYPKEGYNYREGVTPEGASGSAFTVDSGIVVDGKSIGNQAADGDLIPYRLHIKVEEYTKLKIFVRAYTPRDDSKAYFRCSINDARTVQRAQYVVSGPKTWGWVLCETYELTPDRVHAFNFHFVGSGAYFDKFFITTDLLFTPKGMGDEFHQVKLGEDTTNYETFKYPLPPFTPKKTRPRVWMDDERIEFVKANLEHPENQPRYAQVLKHASTTPKDNTYTSMGPYIWCNAFLAALYKDETNARKAVDGIFKTMRQESGMVADKISKSSQQEIATQMTTLAIVYDWCNFVITDEEKLELIGYMLYFGGQLEHPYPTFSTIGRNNGHESEGDIFSALFSCAIAIYEDYPEMYNVVGGLIFEEMLSTRNVFYENKHHGQGAHYKGGRMAHELELITLMEYGVAKGLFAGEPDACLMDYVLGLNPDGDVFKNGDTGRSTGKTVFSTTLKTLFGYGNYFKNPYLKDLWYTSAPNPPFGYTISGLSDVKFLLLNDPSVERRSYKELPLTIYNGDKSGMMYARTSWDKGGNAISNQMQVRLNMETMYSGGHDHLDTGHFDIYYKGDLALDSGHYGTEPYIDANGNLESRAGMGSLHQGSWYARTIAHNCMLLYDPNETWTRWSTSKVNEGGQRVPDNIGESLEIYKEEGKTAEILGADYGDDMWAPSFSYMKGDLTKAYSSNKMEQYTRSFVFLNFFDEVYPGALIVFDRMVSKNPEFKKTWLLHTQQEPIVNGNTAIADKTEEGDNGRIINTTLYPKADNVELTTIGGPGKEFWHSGWNWYAVHKHESKDYGEWRLEVSPKKASAEDCFLNVIHVTEASDEIKPLQAELIEAGEFLGAKIKDRVAFFSKNEGRYNGEINFELTGDENYEILFTDVREGQWIIYKDGKELTRAIATTNGGDFSFKGTAGKYRVVKNKRSDASFTRDMDYKKYVKDLGSDYTYLTFNGVTTDIPYLIENDTIYVDSLGIARASNGRAEIKVDKIVFYGHKDATKEVLLTSDKLRVSDGRYLIDWKELESFYFLNYEIFRGFIHNLKGGLDVVGVEYLREEDMAYVVGIEQDDESYTPEYPTRYAVDKDSISMWQIELVGGNLTFTFDRPYTIGEIDIMWSKVRAHDMKLETSMDGENWTTVYDRMTPICESRTDYQKLKLDKVTTAKYARLTGRGNSANGTWFGIYEVRFPVPHEEWLASEEEGRNAEKEDGADGSSEDVFIEEEEEEISEDSEEIEE